MALGKPATHTIGTEPVPYISDFPVFLHDIWDLCSKQIHFVATLRCGGEYFQTNCDTAPL